MVFEQGSNTWYHQSSLFTDFVPVTPKSISTVILGHRQSGKKKKCVTIVNIQSWGWARWHSAFLPQLTFCEQVSFCGLNGAFFFFFFFASVCFSLVILLHMFFFVRFILLFGYIEFLSASRLCDVPYGVKDTDWRTFIQTWAVVLSAVSSLLMNQQYILTQVSLNRNTHKTSLRIHQLTKNVMSRGFQEPNHACPLGAIVQSSPVQCLWLVYKA